MLDNTADAPGPVPTVSWQPPARTGSTSHLVPGAAGLEFAATVPRLAAWILDSIAFVVILVPLGFVVAIAFPTSPLVVTLLAIAIQMAYFILGWRSGARATPGMRLMKLQIGRASDGQRLSSAQATKRWFVLTGWSTLLTLVPQFTSAASALAALWALILLVSVAIGARHQGLHDRISDTAVVRPAGASNTAAWVIVSLVLVLPIVSIFVLIYLGAQVSGILSTVGQSV